MADNVPDNVHDIGNNTADVTRLTPRERRKRRQMIQTLERRQQERILFVAEIQNLIDRRQLQIDRLKAELAREEAEQEKDA